MKNRYYKSIAFALFLFIAPRLTGQAPLPALPGPFGGNITWLAAQQNNLFASLWPGGVYRTTDEGMHWTHMQLPGDEYGNTITVFADSQKVFAATWLGLYQSNDGGNNWLRRPLQYVTAVAALPTGYIAVRSGDTVSISDASGQNWTDVYVFTPATTGPNRNGILVEGDTIYLGSNSRGIYKSYDGGHTWVARNNGFVPGTTTSFFKNGNRIYVSSNTGIYYTDDRGATWILLSLDGLSGCLNVQSVYCYHDSVFSNAGTSPVVYDSTLLRWLPSASTTILSTCYQQVNGHLFCGSMTGVHIMKNGFNDWQQRTDGLTGTSSWSVLVNGPKLLVTEFAGIYQSPDSGQNWVTLSHRSDFAYYSSPVAYLGDTIVALGGGGSGYNLYYTTDTFTTSNNITNPALMQVANGYYLKSSHRFLVSTVDTPSAQNTTTLYYSDNWGGSWHKSTGLPAAAPPTFMEAGPDLYAVYSYPAPLDLYRSADKGATWSRVNNYNHTDFLTGWAYLDTAFYLTFAYEGLFWTKNGGNTWDSLPPVNYQDFIASMAAVNGELYGASFSALYKLDRTALVWNKVAISPSPSLVLGNLTPQGNRLLITTGGGPVCYYDVPALATSVPTVLQFLNVTLYPNPSANEPVQLSTDSEMEGSNLEVYDAAGKLVYQSVITGTHTTIPVTGFSAGTYLAKIAGGSKQLTKKFVVK